MIRMLGAIGLWPGLYCVASLLFLVQLCGLDVAPAAISLACLSVLCTATAAYALDRVKLRSAWIDPGDVVSEPERYAFILRRAGTIRAAALGQLALGAAIGLVITRWAPVAAIAVLVGVVAYAPRARGKLPRPKDIVWLKNLYVGLAFAAYAALVALAAASPTDNPSAWVDLASAHGPALLAAAVLLTARVTADAALCDLDDEPADRRHGTATFPTTIGPDRTWRYAALVRIALCIGLAASVWCPRRARIVWAAVTATGLVALRAHRPRRLSALVDLRFAAEAAIATIALQVWR